MSSKKTFLPEAFVKKFSLLMGSESEKFFEFCKLKLSKSIWVNGQQIPTWSLKVRLEKQGWKLKELPFTDRAFDIIQGPERPGQHPDFLEGLFNLQEKSSMLPALILNPRYDSFVIDACAAPGNKTLQLGNLLENSGKLLACEKDKTRFKSLAFNLKKSGLQNFELKLIDFNKLKLENPADFILLDAPCSSEGLVRKDFDALKNRSEKLVKRKAKEQKKLILKAFELLKADGLLVYSTCSLSPEEDEEVIQFLLEKKKNAGLEKIEVKDFKLRAGLIEWNNKKFDSSIQNCARVYPQDNNSQSFFIAKIRKLFRDEY